MVVLLPNGNLVVRWAAVTPGGSLVDGQREIAPGSAEYEGLLPSARPLDSLPRRRKIDDPL